MIEAVQVRLPILRCSLGVDVREEDPAAIVRNLRVLEASQRQSRWCELACRQRVPRLVEDEDTTTRPGTAPVILSQLVAEHGRHLLNEEERAEMNERVREGDLTPRL